MMETSHVIVYFDGVCGLCNRFVDFLLKHDKSKSLKFAPLQKVKQLHIQDITTVVLSIDNHFYYKSEAAIRAISLLGGVWNLMFLLLVIPRVLRDLIYDWIAKNRYAWFGQRNICRLPTPEEKSRFLE